MRWALMIGCLALATPEVHGKVAGTTLANLVVQADTVVLGTVIRVERSDGWQVAHIAVAETLEGAPAPVLLYLASPTWMCDISSATVGEGAMFFLSIAARSEGDPSPPARLRGLPVLQLTSAGRGRMPLREVDGVMFARVWTIDVELPAEVATIPDPDSPGTSTELAELRTLREVVERLLTGQ